MIDKKQTNKSGNITRRFSHQKKLIMKSHNLSSLNKKRPNNTEQKSLFFNEKSINLREDTLNLVCKNEKSVNEINQNNSKSALNIKQRFKNINNSLKKCISKNTISERNTDNMRNLMSNRVNTSNNYNLGNNSSNTPTLRTNINNINLQSNLNLHLTKNMITFKKQKDNQNNTNLTSLFSPRQSTLNSSLNKLKKFQYNRHTIKTEQNNLSCTSLYHDPQHYISTNKKKICKITIKFKEQQSKKIIKFEYIYQVTTTNNLVDYLSEKIESEKKIKNINKIIAFKSEQENIALDLFLTFQNCDISYLNGTFLTLEPIFQQKQPAININSFEIIKCIGSGGFSKVYLCRFKQDGKFYAMKMIDKNFILKNKKTKIVMNEKNIMQMLYHPHIVSMKFSFQTLNNIIFVLEYCPGGQIFSQIKKYHRMSEQMARFYMIQILLGLEYIHKEGVIYRDFKPQNILLDINGNVKIADFGLAKPNYFSLKDRAFSFCGSPQYMPPEMVLKEGHSLAVDFYCLGAVLYEFVTGLPPFYSKVTEQIYQSTVNQQICFPVDVNLSYELKNLLKGLLTKDQHYRLGAMFGVKQVLSHPWFGKFSREKYLKKQIKSPNSFNQIQSVQFINEEMVQKSDFWLKMAKNQQQMNEKNSFNIEFKQFGYDYRYPFSGFDNLKKNLLIKQTSKSQTGFKKIKLTKTQQNRQKQNESKNEKATQRNSLKAIKTFRNQRNSSIKKPEQFSKYHQISMLKFENQFHLQYN